MFNHKTMDKTMLTPEESLSLITKTIEETKERFKENGHVLVFWGTLILIVIGSQFILSRLELYKFTLYPNYLYPLVGGSYMTYIWIKEKKKNLPKTIIGNILGNIGWIVGMNLMTMGFFFSDQLGEAMAPVFIILLALMIIVCGLSIKSRPLTIGGGLMNLIGLGSFFLDRDYQAFSMMLGVVVGLIIPGLLLNYARRKDNV
ncbi:hypothetical protein KAR48_06925 [bacterium]|nr:hypothetical protein [bacterium]